MRNLLFVILSSAIHFGTAAIPAFPGAEGFGANTPGGRGGKVLIVTTLNPTGPGSLGAALATTGPRIIVFRVSGVINFPDGSRELCSPTTSFITVAGQTSPGGITITSNSTNGYSIINQYTSCHWGHGIFRHLRFRSRGDNEGAVGIYQAHDFIFDHCDFSGGGDETTDFTGGDSNFTMQWCTVANSGPTGQAYGTIIGYGAHYVTLHHVLWAHTGHRAPLTDFNDGPGANPHHGMVEVLNTVAYDIGSGHTFSSGSGIDSWGPGGGDTIHINAVGNVVKQGPNEDDQTFAPFWFNAGIKVHEKDTYWESSVRQDWHDWLKTVNDPSFQKDTIFDTRYGRNVTRMDTAFAMSQSPVTVTSAALAYQDVLNKAGAFPRDDMNLRTVDDVKNGTGVMRKVDDPYITTGPNPPADGDADGMPDCWETAMGLNSNDAADAVGDKDNDGYANIEEYINDMADALVGSPTQNGPLAGGCPTAVESARNTAYVTPMIAVAPSPFTGRGPLTIRLQGKESFDGNILLADIAGRSVRALPATERIAFEGGALSAGIYILRWEKGGREIARRRLVVLR